MSVTKEQQDETVVLTKYDLDLEASVFDVNADSDHATDLVNACKYFYKPNTNSNNKKSNRRKSNTEEEEGCLNDPTKFNLYSISNYRTRELSWAVQYMAMQNQYENTNLLLTNRNTDTAAADVTDSKKGDGKLYYYYNLLTILYEKTKTLDKDTIIIYVSLIIFTFLCINLIEDLSVDIQNVVQNENSHLSILLLVPPKDFIIFSIISLFCLTLVFVNEIIYLRSLKRFLCSIIGIVLVCIFLLIKLKLRLSNKNDANYLNEDYYGTNE